jgi:small subunit ribosomal protein S1
MSEENKELEATTNKAAEETAAPKQEETAKKSKRQHKPIDPAVWDELKEDMDNGTILTLKINAAVNKGVIAYFKGVRGFIPASLLSVAYVEDLTEWVGKKIDVRVITVEPENRRLVLSGKAVEQERKAAERAEKMKDIHEGDIVDGKVERIASFGAFVEFNDGLTGLVHISQMANRRIETPNEVVKVGDEVKVKIIGIKGDKISLSMRAVNEPAGSGREYSPRQNRRRGGNEASYSYKDEGSATTNIGDLLKDIKLDQ